MSKTKNSRPLRTLSLNTRSMKLIVASLILISSLGGLTANAQDEKVNKLVLYNWPNYVPEEILAAFTEETGIMVETPTFSNEELMYARTKITKGRAYDVVVSATATATKMYNEGLLQDIDHKRLTNIQHLEPKLLGQPYDRGNNFSIPYAWGSTALTVNSNIIDLDKIQSWSDLWHRQWRKQVVLIDSMREMFMMALKVNGDDINSTDEDTIKAAYETLRQLIPNVLRISGTSGEIGEVLLSGEAGVSTLWSSTAARFNAQDPAIVYVNPKEGPLFWLSSFVIPAQAANVDNAYLFIDYLLRPEVAARCAIIRGHASANKFVPELSDEKTNARNALLFPPEVLTQVEFPQDIGNAAGIYESYWEKIKALAPKKPSS